MRRAARKKGFRNIVKSRDKICRLITKIKLKALLLLLFSPKENLGKVTEDTLISGIVFSTRILLYPDGPKFRARLCGLKLSRVEGSPAYPRYPRQANILYISLENVTNGLYEKKKLAWL